MNKSDVNNIGPQRYNEYSSGIKPATWYCIQRLTGSLRMAHIKTPFVTKFKTSSLKLGFYIPVLDLQYLVRGRIKTLLSSTVYFRHARVFKSRPMP